MLAGIFGGWEIVLILAVVLIFLGGRKIPEIMRGLRAGRVQVWQNLLELLDGDAHSAGRSVGGVYGKAAAQALTPDNLTAELYDPAAFQDRKRPSLRAKWLRIGREIWRTICHWVVRCWRLRQ